jgi:tRNA dimethylallyltransferase
VSRVTYIVGATAVGKTEYAIELCLESGAEVISLDSRLWYRGMDIGTAKPSVAERMGVTHHLLDVAEPDQTVALATALELIRREAARLARAGIPAVLVGGTGQYVRALLEGWAVPLVAPDLGRRSELEELARERGPGELHRLLAAFDSPAAARIGPANTRRLIRAIEVYERTGVPITKWQKRRTTRLEGRIVVLERPQEELRARIEARVDRMLEAGLESEVRTLLAQGYGFDLPSMSAVGYREWQPLIEGRATVDDVRRTIVQHTNALVRKQEAWFGGDRLGGEALQRHAHKTDQPRTALR